MKKGTLVRLNDPFSPQPDDWFQFGVLAEDLDCSPEDEVLVHLYRLEKGTFYKDEYEELPLFSFRPDEVTLLRNLVPSSGRI